MRGNGNGDREFPVVVTAILLTLLLFAVIPLRAASDPGSKRRLPELMISADSVMRDRVRNTGTVLIDIRPAARFAELRIPDSLNIPLFAIKTKTFLKRNALVLVDEGYRYVPIEAECRLLRKAGFQIRILDGGLYAWSQKGMPLAGNDLARKHLNRVPPMHFFPENDYRDWIILNVAQENQPDTATLFPRSILLPYIRDDAAFASRYEDLLKTFRDDPFRRVLIVDQRGDNYDRLERVIETRACNNAFFLEGGMEAYRKYCAAQNSAVKSHPAVGKKDERCGGCR